MKITKDFYRGCRGFHGWTERRNQAVFFALLPQDTQAGPPTEKRSDSGPILVRFQTGFGPILVRFHTDFMPVFQNIAQGPPIKITGFKLLVKIVLIASQGKIVRRSNFHSALCNEPISAPSANSAQKP